MKPHSALRSFLLAASSSLLAVSYAFAQTTLTWDTAATAGVQGGTGAWNPTNNNWTTDGGATNVSWDNTNPSVNTALFNANGIAGTGTVTLSETIDLNALTFSNLRNSGPVQKYTISGGTLAFSGAAATKAITTGTSLDNANNAEYASINSAITGAPAVKLTWTGGNNTLVFAPSSGSQALGTATGPGIVKLAGSTTGNTIVGLNAASNGKIRMSSGTWTLTGTATGYEHWIEGGTLIISGSGSLQNNNRATNFSGGTLHWNTAGAIKDNSISTLRDRDFNITGGSIDNTSGGAITSSHNPQMVWGGNWTFIGSNGANSNLNMGTGQVFLNGNRQVTVTNAAATLTVGGVIANIDTTARSLTKAGAGTLELRGANSYTGATNVNAGKLIITGSTNASSAVAVSNSGSVLVVNGTVNGTLLANANTTVSGAGTVVGNATISGNLTPGNSAGELNFTNALALANSTTTTMEINGAVLGTSYDNIDVGGALTYDGILTLAIGDTFGASTVFDLFEFGSQTGSFDSVALTGSYGNVSLSNLSGVWSTTTNSGNETWSFSQATGDLSLTVIPEPSAALLGGLGLLALLRRRRG